MHLPIRLAFSASTDDDNLDQRKFYVDEDGLRWEMIGWHEHNQTKRYLVKYTRANILNRCTYALIGVAWMPQELLETFQHFSHLEIGSKSRIQPDIQIQNISQVLDMTWCSAWEPEGTGTLLNDIPHRGHSKFNDFFLLLQWKDDDNVEQLTWEDAETLMEIMDKDYCLSLLAQWSCEVDRRHDQLLSNCPAAEIRQILGPPGWQYQ